MKRRRGETEGEALATYALGGPALTRDLGCAALLLSPLLAVPFLLWDPVRAGAALCIAAITGSLVVPLFSKAFSPSLATRVELRRDGVHARTRRGAVSIPWHSIRDVSWAQAGDRWLHSEVKGPDGVGVTLTKWLEDGRACAFLVHHGAELRAFPWAYLDAAEWAAPGHADLDTGEDDVIEPAKSGRSRCRACGELIAKGEMRRGRRERGPVPGRSTLRWFHLDCHEES